MQTGLNVGTVIDKQSLEALTASIVKIIETRADQKTIRHALTMLSRSANVEGLTIQNCTINGDRKVTVDVSAAEGTAEVRLDGEAA